MQAPKVAISFSDEIMHVQLEGKERLNIPLQNFPRLLRGTPEQRNRWELSGTGPGIHWDELNEDIYVPSLYEASDRDQTNGSK
ncbi:MAG: DUF2442 domain-containing protein [Pantoea sp.]|uniref:DUF2442 domain-containing protein n=1 Tax=Pantoea brenneri TaxID=472694 RepID=A0AAX3J8K6_9GAMM|nr:MULTISPECIES: DUF2442 domain-containing protein [Pantoea]MBS6032211.1 DUF2442 domain-containing protein [Pantoea sp.]MDH2122948.1 DUF2442 domain-containing protein [Pantoea brenneri]VXC09849.1 conserved hypothetical protein [Pantoea brenneri]